MHVTEARIFQAGKDRPFGNYDVSHIKPHALRHT